MSTVLIDKMAEYRKRTIELFGEMHYDSDEETMKSKEKMVTILAMNKVQSTASDVLELSCSDIEEEVTITQPNIAKIATNIQKEDPIQVAKNLAKYQRQTAARITKYSQETTIHLPPAITIIDSQGIPVVIREE